MQRGHSEYAEPTFQPVEEQPMNPFQQPDHLQSHGGLCPDDDSAKSAVEPAGSGSVQGNSTNGSDDLPPGNHPLEVAARRGIGPMSPMRNEVWHGHTAPCVSCGQLVLRNQGECNHCGQDLGKEMIEKMLAHAGPWYVFEHVRPFPGVTLERIVRQIRRGLLTEMSIVRGPATDHQWRFAVETPGLCRYFDRCWNCHAEVTPSDSNCSACLSSLSFEIPRSTAAAPMAGITTGSSSPSQPDRTADPDGEDVYRADSGTGPSPELTELTAALDEAEVPVREPDWKAVPRIAGVRATWVVLAMLIIVIAALLWISKWRSSETSPSLPGVPGAILSLPYIYD